MKKKNIILTGIMGCGKTTIGRELAGELNMKFLDLDQYIEDRWGCITDLFRKGEAYFRDLESQAVLEVCEREGLVIATGGGVIVREENTSAFNKKGIIFFIDRSLKNILSDINTSERPLLAEGKEKLESIFNKRYPLYVQSCDIHIKNDQSIDQTIKKIKESWEGLNVK